MGTLIINPFLRKPWTPSEITSQVWFDADDDTTISITNGNVVQWNDKSGNNRNATQADSVIAPIYSTGFLNGKPVLSATETQYMTFQGVHDASWSVVMVGESINNKGGFVQFGGVNSFGSLFREIGYKARPTSNGDAVISVTAGSRVLSATYGVGDINIWQDGIIGTPGTGTGVSANAVSTLFGLSSSIYLLNGHIAELVVVNGVLSVDNRQKLEGYLAHKWRLTASLPVNHPYKNTPPYV